MDWEKPYPPEKEQEGCCAVVLTDHYPMHSSGEQGPGTSDLSRNSFISKEPTL